ncbi:RNA polymerase sigma factor [Clostridium intestinale]|uniref:RNA polymerase sigma factor n=1 Tax=Clostridium intestinale TaxID=36845 RepID=UPI002DD63C35|nr:sigma factor [Clostridium intestinale]WRY50568.1 sigma factor [Clostridium intestinale]
MKVGENVISIYNMGLKREKTKEIDKKEFATLIETYKVSLYRVAKGILRNEYDVEDSVSESVLKAFKNLNKLKDKNNFKA